jgi:hypothetical protein
MFCGLLVWSTIALAPPNPPPPSLAPENPPIFPLRDVKIGQKGRGYTVFSSTRGLEPFDAEVLGIMHGYLGPGEDLIIARLSGAQIERTGVISGMSGSPVYIDGKLVGAVGYRFGQFTKDPIAGITPIERMMTAQAKPQMLAQSTATSQWGAPTAVAVPLVVGNVLPHVLAAFTPMLEARGYHPVAGGAGSAGQSGTKPERLFAGGPIAGVLVSGDTSMAGIGTVTWVGGDRFLAFGHPFNATGEATMPVANADIVTTVASDAGSWKMGQPTTVVGALTDDRLHAIAGTMGPPPTTIPVDVTTRFEGPRAGSDARQTLHFDVAAGTGDSAMLVAMAIANSLGSRVGAEKGGTWDAVIEATVGPSARAQRRQQGFDARTVRVPVRVTDDVGTLDVPLALQVLGVLGQLTTSEFVEAELRSVRIRIDGKAKADAQRALSARADVRVVDGQRELSVFAETQRYLGSRDNIVVRAMLPAGLAEGPAQVVLASPEAAARLEREASLVPLPRSYSDEVTRIERRPAPGTWSLFVVREEAVPRLQGQKVQGLPPSLLDIVGGSGGAHGTNVGDVSAVPLPVATMTTSGVTMGEVAMPVMIPSLHVAQGSK